MYLDATWSNPPSMVQRDLAVLRTLAQFGWLTTEHVHALCFPDTGIATVRITLRALEDAGWMCHARWRIKGSNSSHIWTVTTKGLQLLAGYGLDVANFRLCDLVRPSTGLEHVEWRIELAARTLITHLVLEARQLAVLAYFSFLLPKPWSKLFTDDVTQQLPDVVLSIIWSPSTVHTTAWLPWTADVTPLHSTPPIDYMLFFDRMSWVCALQNLQAVQPSVRIVLRPTDSQQDVMNMPLPPGIGQVCPWERVEQSLSYVLQQTPTFGNK